MPQESLGRAPAAASGLRKEDRRISLLLGLRTFHSNFSKKAPLSSYDIFVFKMYNANAHISSVLDVL